MKRNAFVAMATVAAAPTAVADRMNILVGCNDDWKVNAGPPAQTGGVPRIKG